MKTITLAIPTYNSTAEHVIEALESIRHQTEGHAARVQVVIVDNGSDPDVAASLRECSVRFPEFRFVRHDANLGYDRNVLRLLESVQTDFVWFFGDDDILLDFALDDMLAAIDATPEARAIVCRAQFFHETQEVVQRPTRLGAATQVIHGPDFMVETAFTAAALSSLCLSVDAVRAAEFKFGLDTSWVHFAALLFIASDPAAACVFIDDGLVAVRRSNATRWFANFGNQYRSGLGLLSMIHAGVEVGVHRGIYEFFRTRRFATNHVDIVTLAWPLTWAVRRELQSEARTHFSEFARFRMLDTPLLMTPNWFKALGSALIRLAGRVKRALPIRGARA